MCASLSASKLNLQGSAIVMWERATRLKNSSLPSFTQEVVGSDAAYPLEAVAGIPQRRREEEQNLYWLHANARFRAIKVAKI